MAVPQIFLSKSLEHPIKFLLLVFVLWKTVLLVVAILSPGPGYDTSTTLVQPYAATNSASFAPWVAGTIANKLTRWDGIYLTKIANRGCLFEQEWAFRNAGWTMVIGTLAQGIGIAHIAHLAATLCLYKLVCEILPAPKTQILALTTAALHIFSPAGMFLSAPYGESLFAFLSFAGYLLFAKGVSDTETLSSDGLLIAAGAVFGYSTNVRSNGILNGILFLEEVIRTSLSLTSTRTLPLRHLLAAVIGGAFIGIGFAAPQIVAYLQYCGTPSSPQLDAREWCSRRVPSIYSFVQSHYWGVGFLKYWTVSNIPLFAVAIPMLVVMIHSGTSMFYANPQVFLAHPGPRTTISKDENARSQRTARLLRSFSVPQIILAFMAITNYHVQIINRISSAYPIWYIWLASEFLQHNEGIGLRSPKAGTGSSMFSSKSSIVLVRVMILYALIQGGLFASFLPPA